MPPLSAVVSQLHDIPGISGDLVINTRSNSCSFNDHETDDAMHSHVNLHVETALCELDFLSHSPEAEHRHGAACGERVASEAERCLLWRRKGTKAGIVKDWARSALTEPLAK